MSLTVKHLNSDASFLLTFQPLHAFPPSPGQLANTFTILLDPWITGTSEVWHPKFSTARHKQPPCIDSLKKLPEPDLVVISQHKTDHCHQQTLTQLPPCCGKTRILAEPGAAKVINSWKYFDESKLAALPKWEHSKIRPNPTVYRISVPALTPNGSPGEVTVAFVPQKFDITGLHNAIGITYRPPSAWCPFETLPETPPGSLHSSLSRTVANRAVSVIFSPHGCSYKTLAPYITSHLIPEGALPLTALLHCFDRVQNPWYMGGNICSGLPGGLEIVQNLLAKAWISAHDGDKDVSGFATTMMKVDKYAREEVESVISPRSEKFLDRKMGTEAVVLRSGEEITLSHVMDFWAEGI